MEIKIHDNDEIDFAINEMSKMNNIRKKVSMTDILNNLTELEKKSNIFLESFKRDYDLKSLKKLHHMLKRIYGNILLTNIINKYSDIEETISKTIMMNILEDIKSQFSQSKSIKWMLHEKSLVAIMVLNDIKPKKYIDYLGVTTNSLAYQIKQTKQIVQ